MLIKGTVIKGDGYGRKLGYPTANLDRRQFVRSGMKIKLGVWSGVAGYKTSDKKYKSYNAAIVIGPIDKNNLPKIEAHLIGFRGNLYNRKIELVLINYLRPFKKFNNTKSLKEQIERDVKKVVINNKVLLRDQ
ncbi:MAG: riboflavin kinase [Candidatus Doudnabacteria bacterium]|nr:riboflavin kinase [Candidatus Doudnabacteria bacterium]